MMDDLYNLFQSTSFNIVMAAYLNVGVEWKHMVNDFQYVRIYYVREGNATIELVNGSLELKEGHMYFIPAFCVFSGTCQKKFGHYFIHIIPDLFTDHFFKILDFKRELPLDRDTADYLFCTVANNYRNASTASKIATDGALRMIFSYFFGDYKNTSKHDLAKFTAVFNYIDKNIGNKIYLEDLADIMYMDKVYFSNLFKKTFGVSPQQYILQKKLDRSRTLLLNPDMNMADIAEALNFFDAASFTNFFKKQMGMTPKQFRLRFFEENAR